MHGCGGRVNPAQYLRKSELIGPERESEENFRVRNLLFDPFIAVQMYNFQRGKLVSQPFGKPRWGIPKIKPVVHNHQKLHGGNLTTGRNGGAKFHSKKFQQEHSRI
jgi:hypothetical protein